MRLPSTRAPWAWAAYGLLATSLLCRASWSAEAGGTDSPYIEAQRAEARSDFASAETLYDRALAQEPGNTAALFGRARMRSWRGNFEAAIRDYREGLARDPTNPQALSGLGWTYAWSHHFDEAVGIFERLEKQEPYYLDARKGLAYVALWRGDSRDARRQFETLAKEDQGNPDYVLAIGQAAFQEGDLNAARDAYAEALRLKPDLAAARSGLASVEQARVQRSPSLMVLGGRSSSGDQSHTGLRYAQLALQVDPALRLWVIHDRGVGYDLFTPDRRLLNSSQTTFGGLWNYTHNLGARLEAGFRSLPGETDPVVTGEQIFFLGDTIPKAGFWWTRTGGRSLWVVDAGVFRRFGPHFSLEPTIYEGYDGTNHETRGALLATWTTARQWQLGLGGAFGYKQSATGSRRVDRIFGNVIVPLDARWTLQFYGWRENTQGLVQQTVLAAGFTVYL